MSKSNDIYKFIVRYKLEHQYNSPSFEAIRKACNISSKSVVDYHIKELKKAGLLEQDGVKNITIPGLKLTQEQT